MLSSVTTSEPESPPADILVVTIWSLNRATFPSIIVDINCCVNHRNFAGRKVRGASSLFHNCPYRHARLLPPAQYGANPVNFSVQIMELTFGNGTINYRLHYLRVVSRDLKTPQRRHCALCEPLPRPSLTTAFCFRLTSSDFLLFCFCLGLCRYDADLFHVNLISF